MSGATSLRTFFQVVLPLLGPVLVVVATQRFLFASNQTSTIILLATTDTQTISLLTINYIFQGLRESAAVTTVIITVLTVIAALVARRFGSRGVGVA